MIKLSDFYESIFGSKTYKLSLDAGCTCPNRDGTKSFGGCIFCSESGSGDFASSRLLSISEQVESAKKRVEAKIKGRSGTRKGKYIAYFQNFTSTYGDSKVLLSKYREALSCDDVAGLAIATRPDCLGEEILSGIAEIAENHFVQIELGLQTSNEKTGSLINRCYTNDDYIQAVQKIRSASEKIHIVTHLIFGLPGENEKDMLESVKFVVKQNSMENPGHELFWGIKITVLYVLRNAKIAEMYESGELKTLSKEEYFLLLRKAVEILPENCVIHRLTGDPPKNMLISPLWPMDKKRVLNEIKEVLIQTEKSGIKRQ